MGSSLSLMNENMSPLNQKRMEKSYKQLKSTHSQLDVDQHVRFCDLSLYFVTLSTLF